MGVANGAPRTKPGTLPNTHVGRHSGRTMEHSSTAKGCGLLVPEGIDLRMENLPPRVFPVTKFLQDFKN